MTTNTPYIEWNENGNTLFDIPYSEYRKLDESLKLNNSIVNGLRFEFSDMPKSSIERLLKRAMETCTLFRVSTLNGWKKLLPEIEIIKI